MTKVRHFLNLSDFEPETLKAILASAHALKNLATKIFEPQKVNHRTFVEDNQPVMTLSVNEMDMVDDVMTDCLLLVQHLLNKTLIKVERDSNSLNPVLINRTEFQQVLINLIVNAIHSMEDGGTLTLKNNDKFQDGKNGVLIEITDTGKGMAPDVLKRAFDPFFTTKQRMSLEMEALLTL